MDLRWTCTRDRPTAAWDGRLEGLPACFIEDLVSSFVLSIGLHKNSIVGGEMCGTFVRAGGAIALKSLEV